MKNGRVFNGYFPSIRKDGPPKDAIRNVFRAIDAVILCGSVPDAAFARIQWEFCSDSWHQVALGALRALELIGSDHAPHVLALVERIDKHLTREAMQTGILLA